MRTDNIQRSLLSMPGLKLVFMFALLIALANTSTAYSIVFRDGHKVEVPSDFIVTMATLTYEAAPGINRTVQVLLIDVVATERANHEAPGSFFKHAEKNIVASPLPQSRHAQHTLTNRDLEPIRQRRIESEQNYEKRRIELGLPSIEETRRRQAVEEEATLDLARRRAAAQASDEAYWRSRARALRDEIVPLDAEINYLCARLGQARQFPFVSQGFVNAGSFGLFARSSLPDHPGAGRLGTQARPNTRSQGMTNLGAVALRPQWYSGGFGFPRNGVGSSFAILPYGYYDNSFDLGLRLNDLLQRRAGLEEFWRALEIEARIAQVPQVWLAP
jgi:hypothetical protein